MSHHIQNNSIRHNTESKTNIRYRFNAIEFTNDETTTELGHNIRKLSKHERNQLSQSKQEGQQHSEMDKDREKEKVKKTTIFANFYKR